MGLARERPARLRAAAAVVAGLVVLGTLAATLNLNRSAGNPQAAGATSGWKSGTGGPDANVGSVVTWLGTGESSFTSVALQADGRIVAAGYAKSGAHADFAVARFNADGTLDATFGRGGTVVTDVSGRSAAAASVLVQADGRIVAVGNAGSRIALVRYTPDGRLDPTFGRDGTVVGPVRNDRANAAALQPDGKIVLAGVSDEKIAVTRYTMDGALDTGFGTRGRTRTLLPGTGHSEATSVAVQPDGRIVAAGHALRHGILGFALVRYTGDGDLDRGFGARGANLTRIGGGRSVARGMALQPDGRILAVGEAGGGLHACCFGIVRYTAEGEFDETFGDGGTVLDDAAGTGDGPLSVAVQPDGRIVVAGRGNTDGFTLARYDQDGTRDVSFGVGGSLSARISGDRCNYYFTALIAAVAVQADGGIVVAGQGTAGCNLFTAAMVRYR